MFRGRRRREEPTGPQRGRGGGKVRARPQRKAARRRRQGLADYLFLGVLGGTIVLAIERFALHLNWGLALVAGVVVAFATVAWSVFLDRRRNRSVSPPKKKR